ncbi:phage major capsid protein [Eubacterium multiforme]|uniref:HK97 family phage major capsid protein n=1 Tax=Eubacterium multiforme TaxID=83339 RepID=A0ABT9US40_9FIRM|nr:phage major capsid protein [Eubacterium multiforme]MDQ0149129.1 HK97 family phage major capsid protein [Eubacterium multiforme]
MKKIDDLRNQLKLAQEEGEKLQNSENADEILACAKKISAIKAKIALEEAKEEPEEVEDIKEDEEDKKITNKAEIFVKALIGNATKEELQEIKNLMVEGDKSKGGAIVPDDAQTKIIEFQRKEFDIRPYINVEPVSTLKGSRPLVKNEPDASGFASVDEGAEIQELHEPEFDELEYSVRKYAGFIPITNELLEDTPENILAFIEKWIAKNELNTYAYQVFNGTGNKAAVGILTEATKTKGALLNITEKVDETPTIKKFKSVFNKDLDDIASDNICIFVNSDGYDYLDGMEDKKGNPYLQPDVTKASGFAFKGKEIVKVPNKFLKNITDSDKTRVPFIIGDLKALYTMFDRKQMSIESSRIGGEAWRKDKTELKGVFRFDGQLVDKQAVKILLVDSTKLV